MKKLLMPTREAQYEPEKLLDVSLDIHKFIEKHKIQGKNGISYEINPGGPVDLEGGPVHGKHSLYSGSSGIGIFLLRLYDVTGNKNYISEAEQIANELMAENPGSSFYTKKYEAAPESGLKITGWHIGVYSGPTGAGLFLIELYRYNKNERYIKFAEKLADDLLKTGTAAEEDGLYFSGDLDLFSDAGFILYFLKLYSVTQDEKYLIYARKIAKYIFGLKKEDSEDGYFWYANDLSLVGFDKDCIYPGLAHGTAGIAFALAALYEYDKEEFEIQAAKGAALFLMNIADYADSSALIPYIYDGRENSKWNGKYYIGFCHGPAGASRLYQKLYKITGDTSYMRFTEKLADGIIRSGAPERNSWGLWNSFCWCCGTPGLVEYFTEQYRFTGNNKYLNYAKRCALKVIADSTPDAGDGRCFYGHWDRTNPRAVESYTGLYIGAAGAACGLLRLYAQEKSIPITKMFEYM